MSRWLMLVVAGLLATPALAQTAPPISAPQTAAIMDRLKHDAIESLHHKPVFREHVAQKEGTRT